MRITVSSLLLPVASLAITSLISATQAAPEAAPPHALFHLDFNSGFTAEAVGSGEPVASKALPKLAPGRRGQAAFFESGQVLSYSGKKNLNKERGSLSIWLQAPFDGFGSAASNDRYTLFREDGPYVGRDTNTLWLWFHPGRGLRADVRDPRDRYIYVNAANPWQEGQWHHLVFTWDNTRGSEAYMDGEWVARSQDTTWVPKIYENFLIGAANDQGLHSWRAGIDELTIFDRALNEQEARELFLQTGGAFLTRSRLFESYLTVGEEGFVRIEFYNPSDALASLTDLDYTLSDANDVPLAHGKLADQTIGASERTLLQIPLTVTKEGLFQLLLRHTEDGREHTLSVPVRVYPASEKNATTAAVEALVAEVNAVTTSPIAESAPTTVQHSPAGTYREAGSNRHDRFAMEFFIEDVSEPHVAVIRYPDDKARTMEMMLHDLTGKKDYQAQIGVFTGDEYPVTEKMLEHRVLFWPHSPRQSFVFMTAEQGRPAAVESIKIYRLDKLPVVPEPVTFEGSVPAREIGVYYEDPVLNQSFGEPVDLDGFAEALTKTMDYMQSFAQGTLLYPLAWYDGPLYGSTVEPLQQPVGIGGIRPHPTGYPAYFTKRLAARDLTFDAGLHMHMLPSLLTEAITDMERIHAGEETVLNMRNNGKLWYGHYHGSDPSYNPLDPSVKEAVSDVVIEIADRYGDEPGFTGITLVLAQVKLFSFGSAQSGYNDINLQGFQKDSGIVIPGYSPGDPQRFAASYQWLRDNPEAWKAWIDWRCQQLHAHYQQLADAISAKHPNLRLTLNLFTPRSAYGQLADYLNEDPVEVWREMGIDPALYAQDDNIALSYTFVPSDYRWRRGLGDQAPDLENNRTAFIAPESTAFMNAAARAEAVIHDRYWEDAIGRTAPMTDMPVPEHAWRVSTFNAAGRNSIEPYAVALNNFDAQRITKGGYLIGTLGMEEDIEAFSRAYRALPAVRFDDVPELADPVRVRQQVVDGRRYFYVLNRLPEPVTLQLNFSNSTEIEEPSTGSKLSPSANELELNLQPLELRTFATQNAEQSITGGHTTVSPEWLKELHQQMQAALADVAALRDKHPQAYARIAPYAAYAETCWQEGLYARLHFLLQEHWVKAARTLSTET